VEWRNILEVESGRGSESSAPFGALRRLRAFGERGTDARTENLHVETLEILAQNVDRLFPEVTP